ncbi:hypothetical protein ACHAWF_009383 [Thalassiosira exigua]
MSTRPSLRRRASVDDLLCSSGNISLSSVGLWERRSTEAEFLMGDYRQLFDEYGKEKKGSIALGELADLLQEAFKERPCLKSLLKLVQEFSADKIPTELNFVEYSTCLRYLGESCKREGHLAHEDAFDSMKRLSPPGSSKRLDALNLTERAMETLNLSEHINAAIQLYVDSKQANRNKLVEKMRPINSVVNMQGIDENQKQDGSMGHNPMDSEFNSRYGPSEMRCLALVSHNGMKGSMTNFVVVNKNVLKKFRLTGTKSTMTMLAEVFAGDDRVVFGKALESGPLGGDAQLVGMMCDEEVGGVIFFRIRSTHIPTLVTSTAFSVAQRFTM